MTDPAAAPPLAGLVPWLGLLGVTAVLWVALHLSRAACRGYHQSDNGWPGPAALAAALTVVALLLALEQPHAWSVGQVLLAVMVALAQLVAERPTAPWSSR